MTSRPLNQQELLTICDERHRAFSAGCSRGSVRRYLAQSSKPFPARSTQPPTQPPDPLRDERRGAVFAAAMKTRSMKSFDLVAALMGSQDPDIREVTNRGRDEHADAGFKADGKAITLPLNAPVFSFRVRNDMTATTGTSLQYGGMTAVQDAPLSFFEVLREKFVLAKLGATMLPGLKSSGNILLIDGGAGEVAELSENEAAVEETATLSAATVEPHRISGYVEISTQLLKSASPASTSAILDALVRKVARRLEMQAIRGDGIDPNISGLLSNGSIGTVDCSTLNAAAVNGIEDAVGDNAETAPAWLFNSAARLALRTASLWNDAFVGGPVLGHHVEVSGSVPTVTTSKLVFGDWSKLVIPTWGAIELLRNPYSGDTYGIERINFTLYADAAVGNPAAFAIGTGVVV